MQARSPAQPRCPRRRFLAQALSRHLIPLTALSFPPNTCTERCRQSSYLYGRARMGLLVAALLAALASAVQTHAGLSTEIIYAPTNAGLKPQRLLTFGRTHYFQLADNPRGTLVRGATSLAPCASRLPWTGSWDCTHCIPCWSRRTLCALGVLCCDAGHLPRLRPIGTGVLPVRPAQLPRMPG